jgi:hypothetical protein
MNKRWHFRRVKRPLSDRLGIGNLDKVLSSIVGLNVFSKKRPLPPSPWTQGLGGGASTSLIPARIPIGRKQY